MFSPQLRRTLFFYNCCFNLRYGEPILKSIEYAQLIRVYFCISCSFL